MTTETTPAVERGAAALNPAAFGPTYEEMARQMGVSESGSAWSRDMARRRSRDVLAAALSDPDDPDWLARTLFVLHHSRKMTPELALMHWEHRAEPHRVEWRVAADGLRAAILGVTL